MKKSKLIMIIAGVILVIIGIVGVIIHFHNKNNYMNNEEEKYIATVAMEGFQLKIPDEYMATYDSELGLMYWDYDYFDMLIDVVPGDYDSDIRDNKDGLNSLMTSELNVIRPFSEFTIDGRSYVYMLYYDAGVPTLHCYTEADDENIFEIIVLCNEMAVLKPQTDYEIKGECEELILIAHSILRTSEPTDKADSEAGEVYIGAKAYENLYSEVELNLSDKYIAHDNIMGISTKARVNFDVKQDFYCTGSKSKDDACYLKLYSDYNDTLVTVYLLEKDVTAYDVKKDIKEGCRRWGDEASYVAEYVSGEHTFYYYTYYEEYVEEEQLVEEYNFVAMADLGDGYVYTVECNSSFEDINNPDFYMDFFNVNLVKP